jgi:hypothetical protein
MIAGFCSSGAHEHPELLKDPRNLQLAGRGCRSEQRGGGLPGLRTRREPEVGEFRLQGFPDLAPDMLLRAAAAEAWHIDRLYVRAARTWAAIFAETGLVAAAVKAASAWASIGDIAAAEHWLTVASGHAGTDCAELISYVDGLIKLRSRDYDGAAACLAKAAGYSPGQARSLNTLGVVRKRQHRPDDAAAAWAEALRRDPGHALTLVNLASTLETSDALNLLCSAVESGVHEAAPFAALHNRYAVRQRAAAACKVSLRSRWHGRIPLELPASRRPLLRVAVDGKLTAGGSQLQMRFSHYITLVTRLRVLLNPGWTVAQRGTVLRPAERDVCLADQPTLGPVHTYDVESEIPLTLSGQPQGSGTALLTDRIELDGRSAWLPILVHPAAVDWQPTISLPADLHPRWSQLRGSTAGPGMLALPESSWLSIDDPTAAAENAMLRRWFRFGASTWAALLGAVPLPPIGIVEHERSTLCYTRDGYVRSTRGMLARPDQWSQLAHEAGHLWWGNQVMFEPHSEWLAEALAEYTLHRLQDTGVCNNYRTAVLERCLGTDGTELASKGLLRLAQSSGADAAFALRAKGGFMIAALARILGPAVFDRLLLAMADLGRHSLLRDYDFFAVASWLHGRTLTWFANQWLHADLLPVVQVTWRRTASRHDGDTIRIDIESVSAHCFGENISITLHGDDGQIACRQVNVDSGHAWFSVDIPFRLCAVIADEDRTFWLRAEIVHDE